MGPSKIGTTLMTLVGSVVVLALAYNAVDTNDTVRAAEKSGYTNVKVTNKTFTYSTCGKYYLALVTVTATDKNGQVQTLQFCAGQVEPPQLHTK